MVLAVASGVMYSFGDAIVEGDVAEETVDDGAMDDSGQCRWVKD